MSKNHVGRKAKKYKKVRGEANELISIMAILCVQAIERRNTPSFCKPCTIIDIYKDKDFLDFIKESYAYDKDLKILANNFDAFLRVIEKVANRK